MREVTSQPRGALRQTLSQNGTARVGRRWEAECLI